MLIQIGMNSERESERQRMENQFGVTIGENIDSNFMDSQMVPDLQSESQQLTFYASRQKSNLEHNRYTISKVT